MSGAPFADELQCPMVAAGFAPQSFIQAVDMALQAKGSFFANAYAEVVHERGNRRALALQREIFDIVPARW